MKKQHFISFTVAALAFAMPFVAAADDSDTNNLNHFSFSARIGFNIRARFVDLGNLALRPNGQLTPNGDPYNFADGYVYPAANNNYGGMTWYYGYNNASQIAGNAVSGYTATMGQTGPSKNVASGWGTGEDDPTWGGELTYDRELGNYHKLKYGVEAALNYMNISLSDSSTLTGDASNNTNTYAFVSGVQQPPPAPYQGTFQGPGAVIYSAPISSTSTPVPGGETISGHREFNADIWGLRLGPYIEYPVTKKLDVSFSGGLALALVDATASWNETVLITGGGIADDSGSGSDTHLMYGFYVRGNATWQLSERWSVEGGAQFQDLGTYQRPVGGRTVEMDLSKSIFITFGLGYKF